jgi:hypothetical protein
MGGNLAEIQSARRFAPRQPGCATVIHQVSGIAQIGG